jgi:hypothetical protein
MRWVLGILLLLIVAMVLAVRYEPADARCRRIAQEQRRAEVLSTALPSRPSDLRWAAEHCWQGSPRQ